MVLTAASAVREQGGHVLIVVLSSWDLRPYPTVSCEMTMLA